MFSGAITKIKPKRNAVIVEWHDGKPVVYTECKDYEMEHFLVTMARGILALVERQS